MLALNLLIKFHMAYFHKNLTQERWNGFNKKEQILNIASELLRSKKWTEKGNNEHLKNSLDRALELIDLTINDRKKWQKGSLKELLRLREILSEFYIKENKPFQDIVMLLKNFLFFNKDSALVKI